MWHQRKNMHLPFECRAYIEPLWAMAIIEGIIREPIRREENRGKMASIRLHAFLVLYWYDLSTICFVADTFWADTFCPDTFCPCTRYNRHALKILYVKVIVILLLVQEVTEYSSLQVQNRNSKQRLHDIVPWQTAGTPFNHYTKNAKKKSTAFLCYASGY